MTSPSPLPGHLFVVQADVTTIKSDAWLCPTDPDFRIEPAWRKALGMNENALQTLHRVAPARQRGEVAAGLMCGIPTQVKHHAPVGDPR